MSGRNACPHMKLNNIGRKAAPALVLAGIALAVYANTLGHRFAYDDFWLVVNNNEIRSLKNVPAFFASGHLQNRIYRPLLMASLALDYAVAGLRPWFYHAENILLHAAVAVLLYFLFRRIAGAGRGARPSDLAPSADAHLAGRRIAFFAAALFAVLPVHTEVVANVTSRSELLAALFGVLALLLLERPALAGALLFLGLLAKESAVAIPALAPLLWWRARDRPSPKRMAVMLGALGAAVAAWLLLRYSVHGRIGFPAYQLYELDNRLVVVDWATRLRTALMILGQNLALCFVPYHLSADYSHPQIELVTRWTEVRFWLWTALPILAGIAAWAARRRHPNFARGLAWFLLAVLPVSNLLVLIGAIRAERVLYLPSIGACLMAAEALWLLLTRRGRWAIALITLLLLAYGLAAARRNAVWHDQATLLTATVADAPRSARAHYLLGDHYLLAGDHYLLAADCRSAAPEFHRALELLPEFELARLSLASCLEKLGDRAAAEREYRAAFAQNPANYMIAGALARLCAQRDDWHCAASTIARFLAANEAAAANPKEWLALGNAHLRAGDRAQAEAVWRRALSIRDESLAHLLLGDVLRERGVPAEAIEHYQAAEKGGLRSEALYTGWAAALRHAGNNRDAREVALRGLRLFPDSATLKKLAR